MQWWKIDRRWRSASPKSKKTAFTSGKRVQAVSVTVVSGMTALWFWEDIPALVHVAVSSCATKEKRLASRRRDTSRVCMVTRLPQNNLASCLERCQFSASQLKAATVKTDRGGCQRKPSLDAAFGLCRYRMSLVERYCIKGQELLAVVATVVVSATDNDPIAKQRATEALLNFNEHIRMCRACVDFSSLQNGETIH